MVQQVAPSRAADAPNAVPAPIVPNATSGQVSSQTNADGQQPPKKRKKKNKKRKNADTSNGPQPGQTSDQLVAGGIQGPTQPIKKHPAPSLAQPQNKRQYVAPTMTKAVSTPAAKSLCDFPRFNDLPAEFQKRIFEMAYRLSEEYERPKDWVYISRKVREWIDPFIYESIVLPHDFEYRRDQKRLKLYERTFESKPKEFYTENVKRIFTNNSLKSYSSDFELKLLPMCDNLTSLECWSDAREELTTVLTTKSWSKLETLCIDIDLLPKDEKTFHLPLFQHVTHLDLTSEEPQLPSWESLQSLDALTHMRVYMLVKLKTGEYKKAMDQVYDIASQTSKSFPPNLKHFVILVPVDLLYHIVNKEHNTPADQERWDRMESIRLGKFDPRIMLGSSGDWDTWLEDMSDIEFDGEEKLGVYTKFIPQLTYPQWPRDQIGFEEEQDPWAEVEMKDRRRKAFLSSRKK